MNQRINIAAGIEKNRIALLRIIFCWLATAYCFTARGEKPLPKQLSRLVTEMLTKAEKATYYLLIGAYYNKQIEKRRKPVFERTAKDLLSANRNFTLGALTIFGVIKRLKALQHIVHNLNDIVRQLTKSMAARTRVVAMTIAAMAQNKRPIMRNNAPIHALEKAVPP